MIWTRSNGRLGSISAPLQNASAKRTAHRFLQDLVSNPIPIRGILGCHFDATPIAIIDVETTGVHPTDRVVELAIVRCDPGARPRVVLHTLVDPERPVDASHIHGIVDADLVDAPTFRELDHDIRAALDGCVLAAYNAYFDVRFLRDEYRRLDTVFEPPFFCLMYLRELIGLGGICSLPVACDHHGIVLTAGHSACGDALASAELWLLYQSAIASQDLVTFRDLWRRCTHAFSDSFQFPPIRTLPTNPHPSARRKIIDESTRTRRIADVALQQRSRLNSRWIAGARAEMDAVTGLLETCSILGDPSALRIASRRLLAAQLGLVCADIPAEHDDWLRLRELAAKMHAN